MSSPAKLLFDENFGGPIVDALKRLVHFQREPPEVRGIREFVSSGTHDEEWVQKLANEGWIVVSADRGKQCGGAKLPQVCAEHGVTHVLLSNSVHELPQFEKMRAILSVWDQLCQLVTADKGTRYRLRFNPDRTKALLEPFPKPKQKSSAKGPKSMKADFLPSGRRRIVLEDDLPSNRNDPNEK